MADNDTGLSAFLDDAGLGQYLETLIAENIDLEVLADLDEADLKELGLTLGHRKALAKALAGRAARSAAISGDERRQVTIFFCDLVGSTELASRYDAEDMADILARYHTHTASIITGWSGLCLGTQGDGVVACFGYPKAGEKDAEHAAQAALQISRSVPDLRFEDGLVLHTRIGLATGRVFIRGQVNDSSALVGDVLNLASRLQDAAPTDAVVVGGNTRRLIEKSAHLEPMGEKALKGFEHAVRTWRLDGMRGEEELQELLLARPEGGPVLAGREAELDQIGALWAAAKGGSGRVLVLAGEAGIGKSALVDAAAELAMKANAKVARFFCALGYENSALYPVRSQISHALKLREAQSPEDVAARITTLPDCSDPASVRMMADLLLVEPGPAYPALDKTATEQKLATFALLRAQLAAQAASGPMMILFEDAHWADPTTLELVHSIVNETIPAHPILAIISHRTWTDLGLEGLDHVTRTELTGLSDAQARAIALSIMGDANCPPDIMHTIIQAADGNPLFVEELSRSVAEQKDRTGRGYHEVQVPITLEDSLRGRLDRLGSGKQVVQTGAVIGRRFQIPALARVLDTEPAECVRAAKEPIRANLLQPVADRPEEELMFHHALVQQAAYEGIARKQRQKLHARIAELLPELRTDIAEVEPETLARHHAGAGNYGPAIQYLLAAGKTATARAAQIEAANHYFAAREHVTHLPPGRERDETEALLQALLGGALMATRGFAAPEVHDAFARARELCLALGDSPIYCSALYGLFTVAASRSEKAEALALAEEMLAAFGEGPVPSWVIAAHFAAGVGRFFEGDFGRAERHFDHAIKTYTPDQHALLVEQFGDDLAEFSMCYRNWVYLLRGQIDQSAKILAQAEEMANQLNNKNAQIRAISFRMGRALELGDVSRVGQLAPKVIEMSTMQGYPYWACAGQIGLGWSMAVAGQAEGIAPIVGSLGFFDMIGQRMPQAYWRIYLVSAHVHLGQRAEALDAAQMALDMSRGGLDHAFEPAILINRGLAQMLEPPDPEAAEGSFRAAMALAQEKGALLYVMQAATELADLLIGQGRADEEGGNLAAALQHITSDEEFAALTRARDIVARL